ncbi:MAG: 3'-5' exonuclease [Clostridium sp.]|nr:3'-5' exonuclease [Acetatifactor muris]MCM1525764.1 3'-5' exonuclease [Bacteroides sp.]MCM1564082.1 3'-5' exonuclease [Clostridium sp.]
MTEDYISIDLETTGLNPARDRIIEIGAVKVLKGRIVDSMAALVNPGRRLGEHIVGLTGIRDTDLQDAPYIEDILPKLLDFMEELPLLGHSVLFDFSFLKKAAVDQKRSFEKAGIDTLKIARKYLAHLEHRNLDYLCGYFRIPHKAHRALEDATATHTLYLRLAESFYEQEKEGLFEPASLLYRAKYDKPVTIAQKEQLYRLLQQHNMVLDADVERMTRSEASRTINRILGRQSVPPGGE